MTDENEHTFADAADALAFLEGRGRPTLGEWQALGPRDRMLLAAAGRALDVRQAARVGQASQGDLAHLRVLGEVDADARWAHDEALLDAALAGVAQALRRPE